MLAVMVASFQFNSPVSAEKVVFLKLAPVRTPEGMLEKNAERFVRLVVHKTINQVKVENYSTRQRGDIKEILQGFSLGIMDIF